MLYLRGGISDTRCCVNDINKNAYYDVQKTILRHGRLQSVGCQNDDLPDGGNEYEPIVMTKTETELASQGADFAFRFFRAVDKSLQENGGLSQEERDEPLFVSPLSASFALSMLANGADGETLQELTDALGFSGYSMEEVNAYYKKLMEELPKQDKESRLVLANSLWLDTQFDALATYKGVLTDNYDAEVRQVADSRSRSA